MYVVAQGFCFCSVVHSFGSPNKITIIGPDGPTYIFGWFLPRVPKYRCTWPPYLATGKTVSSCMRFDSALSFKESTDIAPLALFNFSCFFIRHGYLNCNFENYQSKNHSKNLKQNRGLTEDLYHYRYSYIGFSYGLLFVNLILSTKLIISK